jgi:hypothetical protein
VKVRLSGREVLDEQGELEAYEVIAEDVTRQRELEEHQRRQAANDPLTGLANYRRLVDVLDAEIKRSRRTNREFALLLFDMDGLKSINDRHGHMVSCPRVAGTLILPRDSAGTSLHWCYRRPRQAPPMRWPVESANASPMTTRDQR